MPYLALWHCGSTVADVAGPHRHHGGEVLPQDPAGGGQDGALLHQYCGRKGAQYSLYESLQIHFIKHKLDQLPFKQWELIGDFCH